MAKEILIQPVVTEKAELLSDQQNQYVFLVNKNANKLEIRKAVEDMYQVSVTRVNTIVMPAKAKSRFTRTGMVNGRVSAYKKAIVTLSETDEIDFFGDI